MPVFKLKSIIATALLMTALCVGAAHSADRNPLSDRANGARNQNANETIIRRKISLPQSVYKCKFYRGNNGISHLFSVKLISGSFIPKVTTLRWTLPQTGQSGVHTPKNAIPANTWILFSDIVAGNVPKTAPCSVVAIK